MVSDRLFLCEEVGHISLVFGLNVLQIGKILFHQTDLFSVSFALLHLNLLFEVIDFLLVELSLLNFIKCIFDAFKTLFQLLENLVCEDLILRVLRILLKLFLRLLELLLHHFNLCVQMTHVLNVLGLSLLDQKLLGPDFVPNVG